MKLEPDILARHPELHPVQQSDPKEFTDQELANRDLVIRMLRWESEFMCSPEGQARYKTQGSGQFTSLDNEYAFNRRVLREFGFTTNDTSVANYRRIFQTYFQSPTDYDHDVIQSSHYMRNNRCVFYTTPEIHVGDRIPDVPLLTTNPDITKVIILSHFPLTRDGTSAPEYLGQKQAIKNYYANDYHTDIMAISREWLSSMNELNSGKKQIISISGHTHFSYDFTRADIRYINSGAWGFHLL